MYIPDANQYRTQRYPGDGQDPDHRYENDRNRDRDREFALAEFGIGAVVGAALGWMLSELLDEL